MYTVHTSIFYEALSKHFVGKTFIIVISLTNYSKKQFVIQFLDYIQNTVNDNRKYR